MRLFNRHEEAAPAIRGCEPAAATQAESETRAPKKTASDTEASRRRGREALRALRFRVRFGSCVALAVMTAVTLWIVFSMDRDQNGWPGVSHFAMSAALVEIVGVSLVYLLNAAIALRVNRHVGGSLEHLDNKWCAGELIEIAGAAGQLETFRPTEAGREARAVLVRLLPRLSREDGRLLSANQRKILYRQLVGWRHGDEDYVVAVLKALEQIGDAQAIPAVVRLTKLQGSGEETERLRVAALACLSALRERVDRAEDGKSLLRPASPIEVAEDNLLRPADGSPNAT
jgi:hypothetical protein